MRNRRHVIAAATLAAVVAMTSIGAGPGVAGAAPPPVAHPAVVSTDPSDTTPHVRDGRTEAVLDLGTRVIVGGTFTSVKRFNQPTVFARSYLFAYDKATGAIDTTFLPQPDGKVTALLLAPDGKVYVSGQFKTIGGRAVPYLAKIDPRTGAASAGFTPSPSGMVYDMHLARGHLYIGGTFGKVRNVTRTNFAVVDPTTGAPRAGADIAFVGAPSGTTRVMRFDVSPGGTKLVAIGNFATVGGHSRPNAAVLNLNAAGGASVGSWYTDRYRYLVCGFSFDSPTYDVDMSPDGKWFVIVTTGGPGGPTRLCDSAARWETNGSGTAAPTWVNHTGGDSLTSVAVTGSAVYVAGHQRWADNPQGADSKGPGAVDRQGIAALSPTTGKALSWNPGRSRGLVAPRIVPTPQGLYVLSDSDKFAGEFHPRLSFIPTAPTTPSAPVPPFPSAEAFTNQQFLDFAGRLPTAAELSSWRTQLERGTTPQALIDTLVGAVHAAKIPPVTRLYNAYFLRLPDTTGLDYWVGRSRGGTSLRTISQSFAASPEFTRLYGSLNNADFVRLVYRNVLGRTPDTKGLNHWVGQLDKGTSRGAVMIGFSESAEYKGTTAAVTDIVTVVDSMLARAPKAAERSTWEPQLKSGTTRAQLIAWVLALPAYDTRV